MIASPPPPLVCAPASGFNAVTNADHPGDEIRVVRAWMLGCSLKHSKVGCNCMHGFMAPCKCSRCCTQVTLETLSKPSSFRTDCRWAAACLTCSTPAWPTVAAKPSTTVAPSRRSPPSRSYPLLAPASTCAPRRALHVSGTGTSALPWIPTACMMFMVTTYVWE